MGRFLYPVDTDQFADIRKDGKVYVDKTDRVFDLVGKYRYVFLARPRRFGKSLLCNTFKAYFQGEKELFEGLKIAELEKEASTVSPLVQKKAASRVMPLLLPYLKQAAGYLGTDILFV